MFKPAALLNRKTVLHSVLTVTAWGSLFSTTAGAQVGDMFQEQAKERQELQQMRDEVRDIKGTINDAVNQINEVKNRAANAGANAKEIHLVAKEATLEIAPGVSSACLTYNGKMPGPVIRAREGDVVRVVLHNQLKVPTSLIFHGIALPQSVSGLPRRDHGLVQPGGAFVYQFAAPQQGTYWYHPQVVNCDQKMRGMYGALIVEPRESNRGYEKDEMVFLSSMKAQPSGKLYYLMNGKSAPAIPLIELTKGERVRLRVVNAGSQTVPLSLTGHRFEVVGTNGSDTLEPHVYRDTVAVHPSDRYDLDFAADNPGVWSLASEIAEQTSTDGHFPGGIACVVRYSGLGQEAEPKKSGAGEN